MIDRKQKRSRSNNPDNPNKNKCALAVAERLHVADEVRYLHTWGDIMRAVRKLWSMRSVASAVGLTKQPKTVGAMRKKLVDVAKKNPDLLHYLILVEGHVLLINRDGTTHVDTAPRKRDRRQVLSVYGVYVDPKKVGRLRGKMKAKLRELRGA